MDNTTLPTRFPCWCRAIYAWGGESKKDLGFVEGDLIECLNAGDGQWWMGRLRRDKRTMGLFPSNFVKVLDESFVPVSRGSSPMNGSISGNPTPQKTKSGFRKPFEAYSAPLDEDKPKSQAPPPIPSPVKRVHQLQSQTSKERGSLRRTPRQNGSLRVSPKPQSDSLQQPPQRQNSHRQMSPSRQNSFLQSRNQEHLSHSRSQSDMTGLNRFSHHNSVHADPYESPLTRFQGDYIPYKPSTQQSWEQQLPSRQNSQIQHSGQWQDDQLQQSHQRGHGYVRTAIDDPSLNQDMGYNYRAASPAPPPIPQHLSRAPSPLPQHLSRVPSPLPQHVSRAPSPIPQDDFGSPPPPPPPPHRVAYNSQPYPRMPSPQPPMNNHYSTVSRGPSPAPPSPALHGLTPSPLRDAMDDVMSSLHDMAVRHDATSPSPERSPSPINPWSPEAFEELRTNPRKRRPRSVFNVDHNDRSELHDSPTRGTDSYSNAFTDPSDTTSYTDRMDRRTRLMQSVPPSSGFPDLDRDMGPPPAPPAKGVPYQARPVSSAGFRDETTDFSHKLRTRRSAFELGKDMIGRTFTTKSTTTNSSSTTQSTTTGSAISSQSSQSLMSGHSASAFSATSAGSFARRRWGSVKKQRPLSLAAGQFEDLASRHDKGLQRPETPLTGISYHPSHDSRPAKAVAPDWAGSVVDSGGLLGGLTQLKPKKSGFLRKLAETAKTGAANARKSIAGGGQEVSRSPVKSLLPGGVSGFGNTTAAQDMGLGGGGVHGSDVHWMQVRRDVNRSNSLSRIERNERAERCQLMNRPIIPAVEALAEVAEGDESLDGMPVMEPTNFQFANLQLVDKTTRFITNLPPMLNATSLAQGYICRPYRSDVQRLRAIFTWVSEKVAWEEDIEGDVDTRRVIQTQRGCSKEVTLLVAEMCQAVGIHVEVVRGYLKPPGELPELDVMSNPNHWWNTVIVDGEWRIMDCSLASPTNPKRSLYSSVSPQVAESWYCLTRPMEACYTHIPQQHEQQHICPPISPDILLALPCACPTFFKHNLRMVDYDTSLLYLDGLELMHIHIAVPADVELFAEVEARSYARDLDGDLFESGEYAKKRALVQVDWQNGSKVYTIKALLPGDEGLGILKIYAGKRGLMHSIKDNPYPLALALPMFHEGANPKFEFFIRHPTPHAQRQDLYLAQPQCQTLVNNNTFVFSVRQHASSSQSAEPSMSGKVSPLPFRPESAMSIASVMSPTFRPESAMSMTSSVSGSNAGSQGYLNGGAGASGWKPAKLAMQAPSGKILRMSRKPGEGDGEGGTWETVIKVGERGTWRGLVLADRSARWCVFGEWECI